MAKDPQKQKKNQRRLRQLTLKKYALKSARGDHDDEGHSKISGVLSSPDSSTNVTAAVATLTPDDPAWQRLIWTKQSGQTDVPLTTILQVANTCFQLATIDFDEMDLCGHMEYIINTAIETNALQGKASEKLVDRELVVLAQHQQKSAEQNLTAFIAKQASLANLPDHLATLFKTCKNCGEKFRFKPSVENHDEHIPPSTHRGECRYHPGAVRSWNDELLEAGTPLREAFLPQGRIKTSEFAALARACYWDCCGAKLMRPDADAGRRGRRSQRRNVPLREWEIRRPDDGVEGCRVGEWHVAAD
ncbi:hypothetical protein GGR52DRAFT_569335 [Hypoxylon sp. FL1284]|nr:hypothetical protein GGR52DRAFT_569335 [Hypoxylon sp. FL1284]